MKLVITDELKQELVTLSNQTVFFGHQSVGMDMINGVQDIYAKSGLAPYPVIKAGEQSDHKGPALYHVFAGKNGNPEGKCSDYETQMHRLFPEAGPDVALLKFCYADFRDTTDLTKTLDSYVATISRLKERYPSTRFIYVTVPVTSRSQWWKRMVRTVLGQTDSNDKRAIMRYQFNEALVSRVGRDQVFDLARIESTRPDGKREMFEYKGETAASLVDSYTHDGGHLNEVGRVLVAKALVHFIVSAGKPAQN